MITATCRTCHQDWTVAENSLFRLGWRNQRLLQQIRYWRRKIDGLDDPRGGGIPLVSDNGTD